MRYTVILETRSMVATSATVRKEGVLEEPEGEGMPGAMGGEFPVVECRWRSGVTTAERARPGADPPGTI